MNGATGQATPMGLGQIGSNKPVEQLHIIKVENGFIVNQNYGTPTNVAKTLEEALQIVTDYFAPSVPPQA